MPAIDFETTLYAIGDWTICRFPKEASAKLPSRGMVLVEGTVNDVQRKIVLEPDGQGSHWFNFDKTMQKATGAKAGDTVTLQVEPSKDWPEPDIPEDIQRGLDNDPEAHAIWDDTTPMARWDWIRWIRATNNPATRQKHIEVACSKLKNGTRRPCCFNRSACTEMSVAHNGVLLEPAPAAK